jgi:DUF4097 and DUF4098 domain-containing protein YvlB
MKNQKLFPALFCAALTLFFVLNSAAQTQPLLKRVNSKTETADFGAGGTVTIAGAPAGSITVEGWQKNQVEITAEIEIQAGSENDLATLSAVSGYVFEVTMGHATITSVAPDKKSLKLKDKKFNKALLTMPFRIDYHIKVPRFSDLEINGGDGDLAISGVDGGIQVKFLKTNARLELVGGSVNATFGGGTVGVVIPARSWRGRSADIQLAAGTMNVQLPVSLNADIDASILRTGKIETSYTEFRQRERTVPFTEKSIVAKAGSGGVPLKFTVGDGTLNFLETKK